MTQVSFIVPFWGVQDFIEDCLQSIKDQTYKDFEVILVDDCSRDESRRIAEKFVFEDSRFRISTHEVNTGQGGARNTGLAEAKGKYIWFVDSDDYLADRFALENLVECAEEENSEVILFDFIKKNENSTAYHSSAKLEYAGSFDSSESVQRFIIQNITKIHNVWNKFFTRDFLINNQCKFLHKVNHQDSIQTLWIFNAVRAFYFPKAFYIYRIRPESTITSKKNSKSFWHICTMSESFDLYCFQSMEQSRNARVLTLAKKLNLLLRENASERCYKDSSRLEKLEITALVYTDLIQSKLIANMPLPELLDTAYLFTEKALFVKLLQSIVSNDKKIALRILTQIFERKAIPIHKRIYWGLRERVRRSQKS